MTGEKQISHDDHLKLLGLMTLAKEHTRAVDELEEAMSRLVGDPQPVGCGAVGDALYGIREPDPRRAVDHVLGMLKLTVAAAEERG